MVSLPILPTFIEKLPSMDTTITSTGTEYTITPTKKEIIERLFTQGHINFGEMWVLLQPQDEIKYIIKEVPSYIPPNQHVRPLMPWFENPLPYRDPFTIGDPPPGQQPIITCESKNSNSTQ